jgi:hypothetical protein
VHDDTLLRPIEITVKYQLLFDILSIKLYHALRGRSPALLCS